MCKIRVFTTTDLAQQAEAKLVVLVVLSSPRPIDFGLGFTPHLESLVTTNATSETPFTIQTYQNI